MLPGGRLRLGPNVTLKLITSSSPSKGQLLYASDATQAVRVPRPQDTVPTEIAIPPCDSQQTKRLQPCDNSASVLPSVEELAGPTETDLMLGVESDKSGIAPLEDNDLAHLPSETLNLQYPSGWELSRSPPSRYIRGPFRVLRVLAKGAFARAVGAEDVASQRVLCLKVFEPETLKDYRTVDGLLRELDVYKRIATSESCLGSIFLMKLEMSFRTADTICFAMDLMAGDLYFYIVNYPAYTEQNARRWSAQLALGINALHNMGILHRDIKVENVLIDTRENVQIADFGLSYIHWKPLDHVGRYASDVKGTIQCMAPEILSNAKKSYRTKYGIAVDWWAFGCVVYELLSRDHQSLFPTAEAVMDYVSWHSRNHGRAHSFPAFGALDPSLIDLVAGLVRPNAMFRYGFQSVKNHPWFVSDGVSEFDGACYHAARRSNWPEMLPDLRRGEGQQPSYLIPMDPRPTHGGHWSIQHLHVDWRNPRSGFVHPR
ncbi:kinase-like domain-containing protein [Suillus paluster]|uniref:kinase-like domain-containing protein n=1 Tax=Suillus paluster TaxID=48578 RepID=UPI001B87266E|nr:kinase-like domain-containing protein [Suillus paluster]KAG1740522.1 kinase-like domain-containing protein [Suillus paluster]